MTKADLRPLNTADRARYITLKRCESKRRFATYQEALEKRSYVYACDLCNGFHRTSKPLDASSQIKVITRLFGAPLTPAKVTAYNNLTGAEEKAP